MVERCFDNLITLYVITCDNPELHKPARAIKSFGDIVCFSYKINHRNLRMEMQSNPISTEWYGYIFSDEKIDDTVREVLPIYLEQGGFDSLIIMKKEIIEDKPRITQAPRIFHKTINLEDNTFLPEHPDKCRFERMLDGWILPNIITIVKNERG